jgi:hypothetical protein
VTRLGAILAALVAALLVVPAIAHEVRPAYLDMRETALDEFAVVWKVPAQGEMRLGLHARLPSVRGEVRAGTVNRGWSLPGAMDGSLRGRAEGP